MDFTLEKYKALLEALKRHGHYAIRHDVDLRPSFALRVAKIESAQGMHATYYFRTIPGCYDEEVIREIAALGHRIGYHYENMTTCNGVIEAAYLDFVQNLEKVLLQHMYQELKRLHLNSHLINQMFYKLLKVYRNFYYNKYKYLQNHHIMLLFLTFQPFATSSCYNTL